MEAKLSKDIDRLVEGAFSPSFPVNPLPFLIGMTEYIRSGRQGSGASIKDDRFRAMLWVVMAQCHGQFAELDLGDEWDYLHMRLTGFLVPVTLGGES